MPTTSFVASDLYNSSGAWDGKKKRVDKVPIISDPFGETWEKNRRRVITKWLPSTDPKKQTWELSHHGAEHLYNPPPHPVFNEKSILCLKNENYAASKKDVMLIF